ncbi:MAG: polyamine aminopropyltransferase [Candidatus Aminicenantes bacterium]|nr:polyamine aminopropyltransferase [Candidatus Aminicenantes bacterium]
MGLVKRGRDLWFFEDLYPDVTFGFKVKNVVVPETPTGFQRLMILESERLGRVLVLDGIVQLTEEDEGIYHEWIAHWPLFARQEPAENVLIIGGGDGGVAREVLRHPEVKSVTMAEIDEVVVDLCRRHMPALSAGIWDDPRFELVIGDGAEVIRRMKGRCDVIIIDSTDPIGPARSLFDTSFYESVYAALRPDGITIHQTGALLLQPFEAPGSWRQMERIFDDVRVVQFANVSYMGGPFSLTAGSRGKRVFRFAERNARRRFRSAGLKTSWYSPEISAAPYPEFGRRLETDKYGEEVAMDIRLPHRRKPTARRVARWSRELCRAIGMVAFGEPMTSDRALGEGETLVQYIETSAINYRRFGAIAAANCFTCAHLPVDRAVGCTAEAFGAESALCWHLPRGAFADVKALRRQTRIYEAALPEGGPGPSGVFKPSLAAAAEVFKPSFRLPVETGFAPAFELVLDIYDCDFEKISSCEAVSAWARESARIAGLKTVGRPDAPDFGHAKKKTAGPSVTQFLRGGSNISHYSMNWLMIVVNIVARTPIPLRRVITHAMDFFRGKKAYAWILPRGVSGRSLKEIAEATVLFEVRRD